MDAFVKFFVVFHIELLESLSHETDRQMDQKEAIADEVGRRQAGTCVSAQQARLLHVRVGSGT